MGVRKGYKQTELGVIPEDWDVKKLEMIANVVGGGTPSTFNTLYWNGEINWFTPTEIGTRKYSTESYRKITKQGLDNSSARILPKGTILLTTRASIGDASILLNEACTNQGFQSLIAKKGIDNEFLYYVISMQRNSLIKNASGSTFLEISPGKVKSLPLSIPNSQSEQTAIATALSDTDALITSLEKLIEKKRAIKQGTMQELLKSKGWKYKKLKEVGEIVTGSTPPTDVKKYWNGSIPWITPTDISVAKNIYNSEREISDLGLEVIRKLPANSLLVTCIASIGKNAILRVKGASNQQINSIIPYPGYDVDFLYYLIENNKKHLLGKAGITATLMISKKDFSEIAFPFPETKSEQTRIATILSDMDAEITALEQKLTKYKMIKQGMMQELLTGKTRLI